MDEPEPEPLVRSLEFLDRGFLDGVLEVIDVFEFEDPLRLLSGLVASISPRHLIRTFTCPPFGVNFL